MKEVVLLVVAVVVVMVLVPTRPNICSRKLMAHTRSQRLRNSASHKITKARNSQRNIEKKTADITETGGEPHGSGNK